MKANNYDALLTYARLLSELQSGELEISWQKITPISKQDHLLTRQHLHRLILLGLLLMVTAPLAGFLSFNEQHTVELLFSAAVLFFTIAILKTELPDAIRILRTPIGTMQPENFTGLRIQNPRHQRFFLALHIGNLHLDAVAGGDFGRFAAAFHRLQNYGLVACGVDDFQRIADGKAVFHVHRGPAVGVDGADLADVLALFR